MGLQAAGCTRSHMPCSLGVLREQIGVPWKPREPEYGKIPSWGRKLSSHWLHTEITGGWDDRKPAAVNPLLKSMLSAHRATAAQHGMAAGQVAKAGRSPQSGAGGDGHPTALLWGRREGPEGKAGRSQQVVLLGGILPTNAHLLGLRARWRKLYLDPSSAAQPSGSWPSPDPTIPVQMPPAALVEYKGFVAQTPAALSHRGIQEFNPSCT